MVSVCGKVLGVGVFGDKLNIGFLGKLRIEHTLWYNDINIYRHGPWGLIPHYFIKGCRTLLFIETKES